MKTFTYIFIILTTAYLSLSNAKAHGEQRHRTGRRRCSCEKPCTQIPIIDMDFNHIYPVFEGDNTTWSYFTLDRYVANDGSLSLGNCGGVLDSMPFTLWSPPSAVPFLDRAKWLAFSNDIAEVPANGDLIVEWQGAVEVFGGDAAPFPLAFTQGENDLRFGAGAYSIVSTDTGNGFEFFLTNNQVYAVYQRYRVPQDPPATYASFFFAIPVARRKPCEWHTMRIVLFGKWKQVAWYLNDIEVFRVKVVGLAPPGITPIYDLGGAPIESFPYQVQYGFGTFTLLDMYPAAQAVRGCENEYGYPPIREALVNDSDANAPIAYNPISWPRTLATYFDPDGILQTNHIWGQGVVLRIRRLFVKQEIC